MFLYNGKYGVASDGNGLYYMRARYYDISIKRFVNQDVVIGHLDATSSLNRYAYCEGNPVSCLDPFGLDRFDTSWIHNILYGLSLCNNLLTLICPELFEITYAIGMFISTVDGVVCCFDLGQDLFWGDFKDVLEDLGSIALDIVGAVSSINAKSYQMLSLDKNKVRLVRAKYDSIKRWWDRVGKKSQKAGVVGVINNMVDWIIKKLGVDIDDNL